MYLVIIQKRRFKRQLFPMYRVIALMLLVLTDITVISIIEPVQIGVIYVPSPFTPGGWGLVLCSKRCLKSSKQLSLVDARLIEGGCWLMNYGFPDWMLAAIAITAWELTTYLNHRFHVPYLRLAGYIIVGICALILIVRYITRWLKRSNVKQEQDPDEWKSY